MSSHQLNYIKMLGKLKIHFYFYCLIKMSVSRKYIKNEFLIKKKNNSFLLRSIYSITEKNQKRANHEKIIQNNVNVHTISIVLI